MLKNKTTEKQFNAQLAFKAMMKQKEDFRKAVISGTVDEYVKKNRDRIAQPL